ncbi:putative clock-controlled pheromone ccg-4 [Diaporthe ampelina]|uniref:Putative clock-controlled pheromone ccg-4 n=1 Tax=Diaporthe ampelina TaxID=1214573 RepID=A0A0G2HRC4_9PEZI|nr:putative clock-controlled pheromone ccg-4 [Diaporthe ampelina]
MKLSVIAVAALSAVSANAIAIAVAEANPSPEAWCFWKGQGCWKAKRAADAFTQALASSGGYKESRAADISNHPGGAAYHAKRSFEELAALVASAYPNPEALYKDLQLGSHFGPDSNLTEADGDGEPAGPGFDGPGPEDGSQLVARDEAAIDPRWCFWKGQGCWKREATPWCFWKGQGCWKRGVEMSKREAEANPWCFWKGQGCWKRTDEGSSAVERRSASPAFCPFGGEAGSVCYASKRDFIEADKRACEQPGEACHKARSAAEALIRAIESAGEPTASPAKRDTTAAAPGSDVEARWCFWKGQGCWKRDGMDGVVARCNSPSGACTAARRDLTSMHAAARNLLDTLDAEVV